MQSRIDLPIDQFHQVWNAAAGAELTQGGKNLLLALEAMGNILGNFGPRVRNVGTMAGDNLGEGKALQTLEGIEIV